jgi:cell division protein FtsB
MITESMTIQGLYVISLSLTPAEKWKAAGSFGAASSAADFFTILAIISLITAVALLFWVFTKYKLTQHSLELKVRELAIKNVRLRQENNKLAATNEELHQENVELYQKQVEALENMINTETPAKEAH